LTKEIRKKQGRRGVAEVVLYTCNGLRWAKKESEGREINAFLKK